MAHESAEKRKPREANTTSRLPSGVGLNRRNGSDLPSEYSREEGAGSGAIQWDPELDGLRKLRVDWDSYGAEPPNALAVSALRRILLQVSQAGLEPTKIAPSAEGGAAVCFVHEDKYADVECFNNGDVLAVTSEEGRDLEVWEVSEESAAVERTLEKIRAHIRA
jgi:hypothetical protein